MLWGAVHFMGLIGGGGAGVVGHLVVCRAERVFAKPLVLEGVAVSDVSEWGTDKCVGILIG